MGEVKVKMSVAESLQLIVDTVETTVILDGIDNLEEKEKTQAAGYRVLRAEIDRFIRKAQS